MYLYEIGLLLNTELGIQNTKSEFWQVHKCFKWHLARRMWSMILLVIVGLIHYKCFDFWQSQIQSSLSLISWVISHHLIPLDWAEVIKVNRGHIPSHGQVDIMTSDPGRRINYYKLHTTIMQLSMTSLPVHCVTIEITCKPLARKPIQALNFALEGAQQFPSDENIHLYWAPFTGHLSQGTFHRAPFTGHHDNCCECQGVFQCLQ